MAGISVCRNQDLANVFYRLHLIEAYGTGMGKIMKAYEDMPKKPVIETTQNTFKIILPNRNAKQNITDDSFSKAKDVSVSDDEVKRTVDDREEQILEYAQDHNSITRNDVADLLQVSPSTAVRLIRGLIKRNLLKRSGKARNTYYTIIK